MKKIDVSIIKDNEPQSTLLYGEESNKKYKYTIIMPTYKRGEKFFQALNSALNQTYDNYEIVIVDNDTDFDNQYIKDKLLETKPLNVRYYKNNENLGAEGNFNRGLILSRGEYITWLHDDDWLETNFLTQMNKKVKGNRAVYCSHSINGKKNKSKKSIKKIFKIFYYINPYKNKLKIWDNFIGNKCVSAIGVIYNKQSIINVGGFNKKFYPGTDYELNMRYIKKYGGVFINKRLFNYGLGENDSLTISKEFARFNFYLRNQMLKNNYVKNNKFNNNVISWLFENDVKEVLNTWKNESLMPEQKVIELSKFQKHFIKYYIKIYKFLKF